MRIRIKQSPPQNLNKTIRLAVKLEAYNRAEKQKRSSTSLKKQQTTPVTTAEASETYMEAWMKSMEANMNALTNDF